jgi:hypothetical protein
MVEKNITVTFIRRPEQCGENNFDLLRTSDVDDGFDVTSKHAELRPRGENGHADRRSNKRITADIETLQ